MGRAAAFWDRRKSLRLFPLSGGFGVFLLAVHWSASDFFLAGDDEPDKESDSDN